MSLLIVLLIAVIISLTPNYTLDFTKDFDPDISNVIKELFELNARLENTESQKVTAKTNISIAQSQLRDMEQKLRIAESSLEQQKSKLAPYISTLQREGQHSFIKILLSGESFKSIFTKLAYQRELEKHFGSKITELKNLLKQIQILQAEHMDKLDHLETELGELKELEKKQQIAKLELEKYLWGKGVRDERIAKLYTEIKSAWKATKPIFTNYISGFIGLIEDGGLPMDTVRFEISLFGSKVFLLEKQTNLALANEPKLPSMEVKFKKDEVVLYFKDLDIEISGKFKLIGPQRIAFEPKAGVYAGIVMSEPSLRDVFYARTLEFSLGKMLFKNELTYLKMQDGEIEMGVKIKG